MWSKGLLLFKTGGLKFKQYWKICNSSKFKNNMCPGGCEEFDNLRHMRKCKKMVTKWCYIADVKLENCGDYLVKCNRERIMRYNLPII